MKNLSRTLCALILIAASFGLRAELQSDILLHEYIEKMASTPAEQREAAMSEARAPVAILGGIYYVGSTAVSSFIIDTGEGLILVDAGLPMMYPLIKGNIEKLGFSLSDIKYIVSSHAHWDHVGGLARFQQASGAKVVALGLDAESIASGIDTSAVSFLGLNWEPVEVGRVIEDGESFTLGRITMQAHDTPGHTKGCTTWTTRVREDGKDYSVLFLGGTSVNAGVKLLNNPLYPNIVEDYQKTFAFLHTQSPDVFLAQHPFFFNLSGKVQQRRTNPDVNPFINAAEWTPFIQGDELKFLRQLTAELRDAQAQAKKSNIKN